MININYISVKTYKKQFLFNLQTITINIGKHQGDGYAYSDKYFSLHDRTMFMNFKKPEKIKNYEEIKKYLEDNDVDPEYFCCLTFDFAHATIT